MTTGFTVTVYSFSYRSSPPPFGGEHGGGFVFDCRCVPNPGREERFKSQHGRDPEVIAWLEGRPEATSFFSSAASLIEQAVSAYRARGFAHLMVSFGCTGGQHRSVYFAERLSRHLREKFGVAAPVHHLQLPKILAGEPQTA